MRKALDGFDGGIVVGGRSYTDLRYADDTLWQVTGMRWRCSLRPCEMQVPSLVFG